MTKRQDGPKGPATRKARGFHLSPAEAAAVKAAANEFAQLQLVYSRTPSQDRGRLTRFHQAAGDLLASLEELDGSQELSQLFGEMQTLDQGPHSARIDQIERMQDFLIACRGAVERLEQAHGLAVGQRRKQPNWLAHAWARCALAHWKAAGLPYGAEFSETGRFPRALAEAARLYRVPDASDRDLLQKALAGR